MCFGALPIGPLRAFSLTFLSSLSDKEDFPKREGQTGLNFFLSCLMSRAGIFWVAWDILPLALLLSHLKAPSLASSTCLKSLILRKFFFTYLIRFSTFPLLFRICLPTDIDPDILLLDKVSEISGVDDIPGVFTHHH